MDRINIDTFVFEEPMAPLACSLQFSPLQKHNFISTSTDFLPQIICTAWSSLLHLSSWANVALAQPRNSGTEKIGCDDFDDQLLLLVFLFIYSYYHSYYHIIPCLSYRASAQKQLLTPAGQFLTHLSSNPISAAISHVWLYIFFFGVMPLTSSLRPSP